MFVLFSSVMSQILFLLSYVSTSNSFPKPLGAKEERDMLDKMKAGDASARNILIEKNLRLVAYIAKKYNATNNEADDLISIGTIGLIKAINTFNAEKGIRLATYASRCIENEILMVIRGSKKYANEVSLEEPIGTDKEGNEISFLDIVSQDDEDVVERVELASQIKKMYGVLERALTEREKTVIRYRYGLENFPEKTQREIAKLLGISRSYVSRIEKKALNKMRKEFEKQEY